MKHWPLYPLLLVVALLLQPIGPVRAQDGEEEEDDGGASIDFGDGCGGEPIPEDDADEIRKKNAGLAGGPKGNDDPGAPKVEGNLQERINQAIKDGVKWLKKKQNGDGSWGPVWADRLYGSDEVFDQPRARDELGPTAWAVYTLAKCGEDKRDPAVRKGMKWIAEQTEYVFDKLGGEAAQRGADGRQDVSRRSPRVLTTYESAAIVLMIEAVFEGSEKLTGRHRSRRLETDNPMSPPTGSRIPKKTWRFMHDRIVHLTVGRSGGRGKGVNIPGTQNTKGPNAGGWRYGQASGDADLSATQFVLLALRAASQAGYPVEKTAPNVWENAAKYVKSCQRRDGGFAYQVNSPTSTGSMTACGVACLVICKEQMELAGQTVPAFVDASIEEGMKWMDEHFQPNRNHGGNHIYYYLYGVERVGDLTGRKEFAALDWYVRGAQFLLSHQAEDGSWTDGTAFKPQDTLGTCFALLFLKRATPPTVTISDR